MLPFDSDFTERSTESLSDPRFPSGPWRGVYFEEVAGIIQPQPMRMTLKFWSSGHFDGVGTDPHGPFVIRARSLLRNAGVMFFVKQSAEHSIKFLGRSIWPQSGVQRVLEGPAVSRRRGLSAVAGSGDAGTRRAGDGRRSVGSRSGRGGLSGRRPDAPAPADGGVGGAGAPRGDGGRHPADDAADDGGNRPYAQGAASGAAGVPGRRESRPKRGWKRSIWMRT